MDELEPSLQPAWDELLKTFGASNVLIVSNSAGTRKDSLLLQVGFIRPPLLRGSLLISTSAQAETVSRNLLVPVLVHPQPKPGHKCVKAVATHFLPPSTSLPPRTAVVWSSRGRALADRGLPPTRVDSPRILVIGDRVTTDMIMAHRINKLVLQGSRVETISVLTTTLHAREGLGTTFLRSMEKLAVWGLEKRRSRNKEIAVEGAQDWSDCLHSTSAAVAAPVEVAEPTPTPSTPSLPFISFSRQPPFISFPAFSLPRFLASLHAPLTRITSLWTTPPPPALETSSSKALPSSPEWTPTSKWSTLFSREKGAVGVAERAIEGSEKVVGRLRERVGLRV